ncbi:MAG: hypothetical protein MN733_23925 [Nitrososphaera sp.]|nr:hypothetical protein [Nitrososphaera sp.]
MPLAKKALALSAILLGSVAIAYTMYAAIVWLFDKIGDAFGRESGAGYVSEKALFWFSHLGYGLFIYLALVALVFYVLTRLWVRK